VAAELGGQVEEAVEGIVSAHRAVRRRAERVAVVLSGCAVSIGGPAGVLAPTRGVRRAGWRVV